MSPTIITIAWAVASLVIGLMGINRKMGFWGYFFGSLLLGPIIGLFLLLASDKKVPVKAEIEEIEE